MRLAFRVTHVLTQRFSPKVSAEFNTLATLGLVCVAAGHPAAWLSLGARCRSNSKPQLHETAATQADFKITSGRHSERSEQSLFELSSGGVR